MVAGFWTDLPAGRVVSLEGASAEEVLVALEPLPPGAPAIVTFRPSASPRFWSALILDELDACARALFPAWLPGAERIDSPAGLGVAAVRVLAQRAAAGGPDHGPFLADLAARALGDPSTGHPHFPDAVRATGLARVIAASYHRSSLAVVIDVPATAVEADLVSASERLAHLGGLGIWLTSLRSTGHLPHISVSRPGGPPVPVPPPLVTYPPLAGRPHPSSAAEQSLEAALAGRDWAAGRAWNQTYTFGTLTNPVRLDLLWPDERCVVEVDGPEHYTEPRYEADRRRDVDLQIAGYAVLRFTNAQIHRDVHGVLDRIEQYLRARRSALVQKG